MEGEKEMKNKEGGFLQLIVLIIALILLMKYFDVSFADMNNWLKMFFSWVKNFLS